MRLFKGSRVITLVIALFLLSLAVAGCGGNKQSGQSGEQQNASSAPVKLLANSVWPAENAYCVALQEFADRVEQETGGNVQINVNSGGALGYQGPELLKAVRDGLVPITSMVVTQAEGDEKIFGVVSLPFLARDFNEFKKLTDIARPYFEQVTQEKWNQKILFIAPWPPAALWTQKQIDSVADMKGLKVRTYDKNGALVVESTGGTPFALPFSEVYSSLATGTINSVITSTPTAVDGKFWEVLDYHAPINITFTFELYTINLDEFNKLDKATQDTIMNVGREIEAEMWNKVPAYEKEMKQLCNENGITTVEPSEDFMNELTSITENIRANWLEKEAPPEAREIVEKFLAEVGR